MRSMPVAVLAAAGSLVFTAPAWAETPTALVEDLNGRPVGVEFMDYVAAGKVIRLGPRDTIVLGYLRSCWRETITGGVVTVGVDQSEVLNGKLERTQVKCDGGRMQLTSEQSVQSAGVISRAIPSRSANAQAARAEPVRLFGRIPYVEVKGGGTLQVERIDQPGERFEIAIANQDLVRGSFYDFIRARRVLTAGGTYRARFGDKQVVFAVDPSATAAAPLLARLLRFN